MADLDDFFAKKDRKKSKAKPKFLTAEELVKSLEDTSKRDATKPKKEQVPSATGSNIENSTPSNSETNGDRSSNEVQQQDPIEEEWKEFEVEERKDYTGLKIGQLTISDDDQNQQNYGESEGYDDEELDNEGNTISDSGRGGPWKKVIPAEEVTQIPMEKPTSKLYISPALRHSQTMTNTRSVKSRNRLAPDITNEDFFPTLGAARPEEQRKKKNEPAFEEVRHGSRAQRIQEHVSAPVSVGNRFKSLEEDDS